MGIIHYLFIAGQEDENAYLPVAHKMLCHILWLYGQWKISLPKYQKWPQICKVNKPHHNFSSKLFD